MGIEADVMVSAVGMFNEPHWPDIPGLADFEGRAFHSARWDLPAGGMRLLQDASGYAATVVNGVVTREHDEDTGERPGRLILGKRAN